MWSHRRANGYFVFKLNGNETNTYLVESFNKSIIAATTRIKIKKSEKIYKIIDIENELFGKIDEAFDELLLIFLYSENYYL